MSSNQLKSVYFIAEAGLNHNGKIKIAHELVDIAYRSGAQAIKFQKRTVSELAIKEVLEAEDSRFPFLGSRYGEIRESLEFDFDQYEELYEHAQSLGLNFIVTPFDLKALDFLAPLDLYAYKIASHSVRNLDLIEAISKLKRPIIMSTGMSTIEEIDTAVELINSSTEEFQETFNLKRLSLLHCVSSYPTTDKDANLNVIDFLKQRYSLTIGYSGHELDDLATLASVSLGAKIVERHITTSRTLGGFDHKLSLEEVELRSLIIKLRRIEEMFGEREKKLLPVELIARDKYNVSMVSSRKINKGTSLTLSDIKWKNPGTGIGRSSRDKFIGKVLKQDIEEDVLIKPEMFE